jgi:hypothetical protein
MKPGQFFCRSCGAQLKPPAEAAETEQIPVAALASPTVAPATAPTTAMAPATALTTAMAPAPAPDTASLPQLTPPPLPAPPPPPPPQSAPAPPPGRMAPPPPPGRQWQLYPAPTATTASTAGERTPGWAAYAAVVGILVLLGGLLPTVAQTSPLVRFLLSGGRHHVGLVNTTPGAILIGVVTGLFALIAIDLARNMADGALAAAGGVGLVVISMAGIIGSFFWLVSQKHSTSTSPFPGALHLSPGAGSVLMFVAGGFALVLVLASLTRLRSADGVPPLLALLAGAGGIVAVIGMCIPTVRGVSVHDYLFKGPGFVVFWSLVPLALLLLCSLMAMLIPTTGGVMLLLGNAAALLAWFGADELVRSRAATSVAIVHHGNWITVLIGLTAAVVLSASAALVPWERGVGSRRRIALTPVVVLVATVLFACLIAVHHNDRPGIRLAAPAPSQSADR